MISVWVPVAHHFQIAALAHWYGGSAWCLSLSIPYLSAGCFAAHPNIGILSHCNPTARLLFQCTSQGCICGASQLVQEHQWLHIPCPSFLQLFKKRLDHTHTEWDIGRSYGLILLNHPPPPYHQVSGSLKPHRSFFSLLWTVSQMVLIIP